MKNIVIFGAPGSGKGTQSDLLIKKYGFEHISTGDVLRSEIKNGTELGNTAKSFIDKGQLIPDELMIDILAKVYDSFGKDHKGVIFDGFNSTIPQTEALKKMQAERGQNVAVMIELYATEEMRQCTRQLIDNIFLDIHDLCSLKFSDSIEKEILSKGELISTNMVTNLERLLSIVRVAITAGTLHPKAMISGINDLPWSPILCINLSIIKAARAI